MSSQKIITDKIIFFHLIVNMKNYNVFATFTCVPQCWMILCISSWTSSMQRRLGSSNLWICRLTRSSNEISGTNNAGLGPWIKVTMHFKDQIMPNIISYIVGQLWVNNDVLCKLSNFSHSTFETFYSIIRFCQHPSASVRHGHISKLRSGLMWFNFGNFPISWLGEPVS